MKCRDCYWFGTRECSWGDGEQECDGFTCFQLKRTPDILFGVD